MLYFIGKDLQQTDIDNINNNADTSVILTETYNTHIYTIFKKEDGNYNNEYVLLDGSILNNVPKSITSYRVFNNGVSGVEYNNTALNYGVEISNTFKTNLTATDSTQRQAILTGFANSINLLNAGAIHDAYIVFTIEFNALSTELKTICQDAYDVAIQEFNIFIEVFPA